MERKLIRTELEEIPYDVRYDIGNFIDVDDLLIQLQAAKHKYEGKLFVRVSSCDYWSCEPNPYLVLEHPETDEAYEKRIEQEQDRTQRATEERRKQYEELKKEFK